MMLFGADSSCVQDNLCTNLPNVEAGHGEISAVLQIVFLAIGAITLIIIVMAGLQLITSTGNPEGAAKARKTLIYAVVGLIIAVSAELIVSLVLNKL